MRLLDSKAFSPLAWRNVFGSSSASLPPYGPPARSFPKSDASQEGFVVEFVSPDGASWVGNSAKGWMNGQSVIHSELGSAAIVVVAGGTGYVVDANEKRLVREIAGGNIQCIWFVAEIHAVIVSNGLWFEAFNSHQIIWRRRRFSWDGIRRVDFSGVIMTGEAFDPLSNDWLAFRVDLSSGEVEGGSYTGPAMESSSAEDSYESKT